MANTSSPQIYQVDTGGPPLPRSIEDINRWTQTSFRRRMLYNRHKQDLERRIQDQMGETKREAWGAVDMSSNLAISIYEGQSVLYDRQPVVSHEGEAGDLIQRIVYSGLWEQMPRIQRDVLGLRVVGLFVSCAPNGHLSYRVAWPDRMIVRHTHDGGSPKFVKEARYYRNPQSHGGSWHWDCWDITDPYHPTHYVLSDRGDNLSDQYLTTPDNPEGDFTGERYIWRWANGEPFIPYSFYQATRTDEFWDAWAEDTVFDGALQSQVYWSQFSAAFRQASHPQRWAVGLELDGGAYVDENQDGSGRSAVVTDPSTVVLFRPIEDLDGQPMVGQFKPGADVDKMQDAILAYERRVAAMSGLNPADISRVSGDPRSGYSLAVTRQAQREMQRSHEHRFRVCDKNTIDKSAALSNRVAGTSYPEGGYDIMYPLLAKSPEEMVAEARFLDAEVEAGHMDRLTAHMRRYPGMSRERAERELSLIADINRRWRP